MAAVIHFWSIEGNCQQIHQLVTTCLFCKELYNDEYFLN